MSNPKATENNAKEQSKSSTNTICKEQSECSSSSSSVNTNEENKEGDDTQSILAQLDFCIRARVDPITIVTTQIPPHYQRGVVYLGEEPLMPNTTIGLYRALLVEKRTWYEWLTSSQEQTENNYPRINPNVWYKFWSRYAVEFTNEIPIDETSGRTNDMGHVEESDDGDSSISWIALPVGDVNKGLDEPSWWTHGILSASRLEDAIRAINDKVLVDWQRLAKSDTQNYLFFNAHLLNEPSPAEYSSDNENKNKDQSDTNSYFDHDEEENIGHLTGAGCPLIPLGNDSDDYVHDSGHPPGRHRAKWCGAAFEAKTSKIVYPGEQLVWCYGEGYKRDYPVAKTCLDDYARESK